MLQLPYPCGKSRKYPLRGGYTTVLDAHFPGHPAYSPGTALTKLPEHKLVFAPVDTQSVNQPLMATENESELQSKNKVELGDSLYSVLLPAMSVAKYMIINDILSKNNEKLSDLCTYSAEDKQGWSLVCSHSLDDSSVEAEMDFVTVSKLPAIKKVAQSSETAPVFILSFNRIYGWADTNVCMYLLVQLMMSAILEQTAAISEQLPGNYVEASSHVLIRCNILPSS
jgi:hypothetical protein